MNFDTKIMGDFCHTYDGITLCMRRPGNSISTGIPNKIELAGLTKKPGLREPYTRLTTKQNCSQRSVLNLIIDDARVKFVQVGPHDHFYEKW